jgi:hypothetical protein
MLGARGAEPELNGRSPNSTARKSIGDYFLERAVVESLRRLRPPKGSLSTCAILMLYQFSLREYG